MKIAYLIEDFSMKGGAERILARKANILHDDYGHDTAIISVYSDDRPPAYPLSRGVRLVRLGVPFAAARGNGASGTLSKVRTMAAALVRLQKAVDTLRPDIIFFTMPLGALLLPLVRTKARKIYESHSARSFTPYNRLFLPMELCAEAVVCLTEDDAREYRRARRTVVIPDFIDPPAARAADYGVKRAVAVGRLERVKGFDRLITCWGEALKENPGWRLDIYGEGSCRHALEDQAAALGLEGSVRLMGRSDGIMDVYPQYSFTAASSRYEGLSMALIEAQACGLPAVSFNFKYGASTIIHDGRNGLLADQDDTAAFTRALSRMMADEALRQACGREAVAMSARFSRENVFKQWLEVIKR